MSATAQVTNPVNPEPGADAAPDDASAKTAPPLTGRQKVAVVYMALGPDRTAAISERLSPEEIESISFEVAKMGTAPPAVVEAVLGEVTQATRALDTLARGGMEKAREILERQFGSQQAVKILKKFSSQIADHAQMERLRKADPQQLAGTLRNEHPQTIALVLAHLDQYQTAQILKDLPAADAGLVAFRMATMEKVSPEMVQLIEAELGSEVMLNMAEGMMASGGPEALASVLNMLSGSREKDILESIAAKDPALCDRIKSLMFVFEDIVQLDVRSMQRLLREVDSRDLALALKVASAELKNAVFAGMTQRALAALKEEMDIMGPVRMSDIEKSQSKIIQEVRRLEELGEIVVAMSGGDDVVVI